jgi:HD-like signal output (HDOD) protein
VAEAHGASRVRALLAGLEALPPMPPVAQRLISLGDLTEADVSAIAAAIELDPALSAGVLRMCRAAHTGLGGRVTTVRQAVTMLGVESVRRLVLTTAVCETLRDGAADIDERVPGLGGFDRAGFWVFCVAVACASERIAETSGRATADVAWIAGLLHGIGRFGLELVAPRAFSEICGLAARTGSGADSAERRILGIDHAVAGALLAEKWGLGSELAEAIRCTLGDAPAVGAIAPDLAAIVRAGRWLCRAYHLGWSGDWSPAGDGAARLHAAGVGAEDADVLAAAVIGSLGVRLSEFGLVPAGSAGDAEVGVMIARQANLELEASRAA